MNYSKTSNTLSTTLQVREQGDPSGAAALTLSVRPQGLLEEEDFDVALLQSGTCSPV